jgi:tryptophan synthase beta chain
MYIERFQICCRIKQLAKRLPKEADVLVNLCGRGDKDMHTVAKAMGVKINWYIE